MVNILPEKAQRNLLIRYYVRLATTVSLLAALVALLGIGFLMPSYLLTQEEAESAKRYADALEQTLSLSQSTDAGGILSRLKERITFMNSYAYSPVLSRGIAAVANSVPAGVTLQNIRVGVSSDLKSGSVTLSGEAATRADLVAFVGALQGRKEFQNVSVPVSDLASDADINFSLSFALDLANKIP